MHNIEDNLLASLIKELESTGIKVGEPILEVSFGRGRLDCLLEINLAKDKTFLAIEFLGQAYPRDIRHAVWQLQSYSEANLSEKNIIHMVVADYFSDGAKESLREIGVAYFEASGTFYLKHNKWLIDIQRFSKRAPRPRIMQLFTGARERVVLALLIERFKFINGLELAKISDASTYTVSIVLEELARREWLESEGNGRTLLRRLSKPAELLDAWEKVWVRRKDKKTKWYCYAPNPDKILDYISDKINKSSIAQSVVFTGAAAANFITPNLTRTDMVEVIIPEGKSDLYASELNMEPAEKGFNVTLIERTGVSTMFSIPNRHYLKTPLANPFILYLDLLDGKGRNKELAEQLRLQILGI